MYTNKHIEIPGQPYRYFKDNKVVLKGMYLFFPPVLLCNLIPKFKFSSFGKGKRKKKRKRKGKEDLRKQFFRHICCIKICDAALCMPRHL